MLSIRTQDRMALVPYDGKIYIKENYQDYNTLYDSSSVKITKGWSIVCHGILGTYATKERALEVLDEIEQALYSLNMVTGDGYVVEKVLPQNGVYQMPKE